MKINRIIKIFRLGARLEGSERGFGPVLARKAKKGEKFSSAGRAGLR
jgi:hypothetical protein